MTQILQSRSDHFRFVRAVYPIQPPFSTKVQNQILTHLSIPHLLSHHPTSMSLALPSVAGPSRLASRLYRPCTSVLPALASTTALTRVGGSSTARSTSYSQSYSTSVPRSQSRRQAYTLAQPINTPSGFEGVPAPAYVNPVESVDTTGVGASGKGKEKAGIVEGLAPPPPAPEAVKPRRKIQAKKAAISMVRLSQALRCPGGNEET